jgi:hypothetical protein
VDKENRDLMEMTAFINHKGYFTRICFKDPCIIPSLVQIAVGPILSLGPPRLEPERGNSTEIKEITGAFGLSLSLSHSFLKNKVIVP